MALKNATTQRGARAELAKIAESGDGQRAIRIVNLLAQGATPAQALKAIRMTDTERNG